MPSDYYSFKRVLPWRSCDDTPAMKDTYVEAGSLEHEKIKRSVFFGQGGEPKWKY